MLLSFLLFLPLLWKNAVGQTASASSTGPTPTCLQPRQSLDPVPSAITSVLASAIPKACDPQLEEVTYDSRSIRTYQIQSFNFNISHSATSTLSSQTASPSLCPNAFQNIIATCIESTVGTGFWGGWVISGSLNYSLSDFAYPKNGLLSASSFANVPSSSSTADIIPGQTGSVPSGVTTASQGTSDNNPSGNSRTTYDSASSDRTADNSAPNHSLATALTGHPSGTFGGTLPTTSGGLSGIVPTGTGDLQSSAISRSSNQASGSATNPPSTQFLVSTPSHFVSNPFSSGGDSSKPVGTATGTIALSGSDISSMQMSSNQTSIQDGSTTVAGVPTATGTTPGATASTLESNISPSQSRPNQSGPLQSGSQGVSKTGTTTNPGGIMITSPPMIATTHVDPSSPMATSDGIIIGGLLSDLSKSAKSYSNDITIPTTKTAFLDDLEETQNRLETLFTDMGGKLPPDSGGCSGGSRKRRRGLGSLVGDVFNTVRCAINSLDTLKGHLDVSEPDIPTVEGDLDDIGSLAENIDDNNTNDNNDDNSSNDDQGSTKKPSTEGPSTKGPSTRGPSSKEPSTTEHSSKEPSTRPSSTNDATTSGPTKTAISSSVMASTRASSTDPCLNGPITSGPGGLVKRANTADSCDYPCPSPVPSAPISGPLAITPAPTDPADAQKHRRDIAGRVHLEKRAKGPISSINNCKLLTPSSPPDVVTTPAYPGGFSFWQQDSNGQLPQSFQSISRYYRTTNGPNSQCAPTVTSVPANALTPNQNDQNEIISVDHAYENGWLQGFFEYIIEPPNPGPGQPQLSCAAANAIFFNNYPGAPGCAVNRMAPIYNALASNTNPNFVVMSQWLNGDAKGWIMGPTFDENDGDFFDPQWAVGGAGLNRWNGNNQAKDSINFKLGHLKNIILGCLIINADNVIPLIQKTNNRVYKAFQSLDTSLQGSVYAGSDFAGKYRVYMEDRAAKFNKAPNLVSRMIQNIQNDLQAASSLPDVNQGERGSLSLLLASYKSQYVIGNNANQWQFQVNFEWNTNNVRRGLDDLALSDFRKILRPRDGDSCPLTAPVSASLPAATGFATGSVGDGGSATSQSIKRPASSTALPGSATSASPSSSPKSCTKDSDCKDFTCSSGDPFCAIAISKLRKRETPCIALDTCPGANDDTASTSLPPPTKTTQSSTESFPTGFCGCKNQDRPSSTSPEPPSPTTQTAGCKDGLYDNYNDCSANCHQGMCQENAGQPQITCSCN